MFYSGSHLRRMRLLISLEVSDTQLSEAVKKLPLSEEFEMSFGELSEDTLELMGKCCPHLKVLKFNTDEENGFEDDYEELAIAKNLPQLRHLQLMGNRLANHGLLAILDGCPNLKSLDLRVCSNVDLSGSLRERCLKQIRDLRLPEDLSEVSIYVEGRNDISFDGRNCGCDIDREYLEHLMAIDRARRPFPEYECMTTLIYFDSCFS
ncbi:putative F-box/LRR-repeat protein 23 [Lotus japonicus]|uniref:putative F-box/LRR-repeat protein 23 n=1 Tax=Lotus japonicus TaxID=34305 RepID=UPI00258914FB|nr:putative F-box/LRR-repeat protein 23 [Lotus japonicus]